MRPAIQVPQPRSQHSVTAHSVGTWGERVSLRGMRLGRRGYGDLGLGRVRWDAALIGCASEKGAGEYADWMAAGGLGQPQHDKGLGSGSGLLS